MADLYELPDNYIYISHLGDDGRYFIIPNYPDSIQDSMSSSFSQTTALSRSAPVWTYNNSGPRSVQFTFNLRRDMFDEVNWGKSNVKVELGDDYVDTLIKALMSIALPKYNLKNKFVEPPLVAIRIANEVFIKGVVNNGVTVTYSKPLIQHTDGSTAKYANVNIAITVSEVDPYDATTVFKNGSFRGITRGLKAGMDAYASELTKK